MFGITDAKSMMVAFPVRIAAWNSRNCNQRVFLIITAFVFSLLLIFSWTTKQEGVGKIQKSRDSELRNIHQEPAGKPTEEDVHLQMLKGLDSGPKQTFYPRRQNMGKCPKTFGKVTVFVAVVESSYKTHYHVAQQSLECYLKSVNYTFLLIDLDHDVKVNKHCKHDQLFFKKHCAASIYLEETDWMLVLDADAGVVNPNHCIEEWIDDRVDLIFYERFFNWEIASGNYLVKNTIFARDFLRRWADWQYIQPSNWNGADNGVLQIHIMQTVMPTARAEIKACDAIWHRGKDYDTYMNYVTCIKIMLGANRLWPGKIRILRRAHGWVRDGYLTNDQWSDRDFMLHGWKLQEIGKNGWVSPFTTMFNISECGQNYVGWNWRNDKRTSTEKIREQLANFEKGSGRNYPKIARDLPYLTEPDVGECYPNCDKSAPFLLNANKT